MSECLWMFEWEKDRKKENGGGEGFWMHSQDINCGRRIKLRLFCTFLLHFSVSICHTVALRQHLFHMHSHSCACIDFHCSIHPSPWQSLLPSTPWCACVHSRLSLLLSAEIFNTAKVGWISQDEWQMDGQLDVRASAFWILFFHLLKPDKWKSTKPKLLIYRYDLNFDSNTFLQGSRFIYRYSLCIAAVISKSRGSFSTERVPPCVNASLGRTLSTHFCLERPLEWEFKGKTLHVCQVWTRKHWRTLEDLESVRGHNNVIL